jgi:hypothetical protein
MKPPICCVCGRDNDPGASLVSFANFQALPPGMVGHPAGFEWFCSKHVELARELTHLQSEAAIAQLRKKGALTRVLARFVGWSSQ